MILIRDEFFLMKRLFLMDGTLMTRIGRVCADNIKGKNNFVREETAWIF
jgi:hypothetical protein